LAWFIFYPDKRIGRQKAAQPDRAKSGNEKISFASLLRYRSTWGIALGQMGYLYAYFFFVSWLPGYLVLDRHMTLLKTGIIASLPFWVGMLSTVAGGWLGDYLIHRGVSTTVSRKSIIGVGLTTSTVAVIAAAFTVQSWLAVTLLCLCVGSLRLTTGSLNSVSIDLAPPSMVGSLTSIQNFFGNVGGLLAPIVTGYLVTATGSFVSSLVVAGGMALFGAICYVFIMGNLDAHRIEDRTFVPAVQVSPSSAL
jgi:MFS family permease